MDAGWYVMGLRLVAPLAQSVDLAPVMADIADAKAAGANAQQMVRNRDAKLNQASADAQSALAETVTLQELAATLAQAIPASEATHAAINKRIDDISLTPGPAGPKGDMGAAGPQGQPGSTGAQGATGPTGATGTKGADGASGPAGPSGTANLATAAAPVGLLALGGNVDVTLSWNHAMPNATYAVHPSHSAVVNLANVVLTVKSKTTTSCVVNVKSVGVAIAAGTLVSVAV